VSPHRDDCGNNIFGGGATGMAPPPQRLKHQNLAANWECIHTRVKAVRQCGRGKPKYKPHPKENQNKKTHSAHHPKGTYVSLCSQTTAATEWCGRHPNCIPRNLPSIAVSVSIRNACSSSAGGTLPRPQRPDNQRFPRCLTARATWPRNKE
jgi:hypothetical protein